MIVIENQSQLSNINGNYILGNLPVLNNSKIIFYGKNNILYCEDGVTLENSIIEFGDNNSIIFLRKNEHKYRIALKIFNNSTIYIDENNYFNEILNAVISEETNLLIGKNCMLSFGIWMLTADPHLIYDIDTLERINFSKSIYIGDHVWLGQNSTILKGTEIDSGSIIGASSVVSNKIIENNMIYAGNPVRMIKQGTFWIGDCVHKWTSETTKQSRNYEKFSTRQNYQKADNYIYNYDTLTTIPYSQIEEYLKNNNIDNRLNYLIELSNNDNKNRFVHYDTRNIEIHKEKKLR